MRNVKPNSHNNCIACGESNFNPNSLQLQFASVCENSVMTKIKLDESYQGYPNVLHGGVISTLLDAAMTHCLFARHLEAMTAELTVRFIKPVPINQELIVVGTCVAEQRGMYKLTSFISLDDNILARAKAKFLLIKA